MDEMTCEYQDPATGEVCGEPATHRREDLIPFGTTHEPETGTIGEMHLVSLCDKHWPMSPDDPRV
jgi:hypothetical protein